MRLKTDTQSLEIAEKYAGCTLPAGAKIIGLIEQDKPYRKGAAVKLQSGAIVQYNAGLMRTLPLIKNDKNL